MSDSKSRKLYPEEKKVLAAYGIPQVDLDNVTLHAGMPWFASSDAAGITLGNDVYWDIDTLPNVNQSFPGWICKLSHELIHVGQYRTGALNITKYLWEAMQNGSDKENKYEHPAYDFGYKVAASESSKHINFNTDANPIDIAYNDLFGITKTSKRILYDCDKIGLENLKGLVKTITENHKKMFLSGDLAVKEGIYSVLYKAYAESPPTNNNQWLCAIAVLKRAEQIEVRQKENSHFLRTFSDPMLSETEFKSAAYTQAEQYYKKYFPQTQVAQEKKSDVTPVVINEAEKFGERAHAYSGIDVSAMPILMQNQVETIQKALTAAGKHIKVDKKFGKKTLEAVTDIALNAGVKVADIDFTNANDAELKAFNTSLGAMQKKTRELMS